MAKDKPPPAEETPPGAALAYDVAVTKLAAQLAQIDALDTKAGVVIGALVVVMGAILSVHVFRVFQAVAVVGLGAALVQAVRSFLVGQWADSPYPRRFAEYAALQATAMKWTALPAILQAYDDNVPRLKAKGDRLNQSVGTLVALGLLALVLKAFDLI
jgi:hypothetical protein